MNEIEKVWQYSRYCGQLLYSVERLHNLGEDYAAILLTFNVLEMMCKSIRESDDHNVFQDLTWLKENNYISAEEESFLNGNTGFRVVRNKMSHKDAYQLFWGTEAGVLYPFADMETWQYIFRQYVPETIRIMGNMAQMKCVD